MAEALPKEVATPTAVEKGELNMEFMMLPRPLPEGVGLALLFGALELSLRFPLVGLLLFCSLTSLSLELPVGWF